MLWIGNLTMDRTFKQYSETEIFCTSDPWILIRTVRILDRKEPDLQKIITDADPDLGSLKVTDPSGSLNLLFRQFRTRHYLFTHNFMFSKYQRYLLFSVFDSTGFIRPKVPDTCGSITLDSKHGIQNTEIILRKPR